MLMTNLKILAVILGTVTLYTVLASAIPQIESEVPQELTLGADFSSDELVAAGEDLYQGAGGCVACHGLGTRAPNLLADEGGAGQIGARCADREPGKDCKAYLHEALVEPMAYIVEGYEPIMPDMSRTLSPTQIWALVAYMESLGGTVTVTADDIGDTAAGGGDTPAAGGAPPPGGGGALAAGSTDPMEIWAAGGCGACHQLNGEGGPIGPPLDDLGAARDREYIRRAILDPGADVAAGYEAVAGVMPATFGGSLTADQLEALVDMLAGEG
ncbi:MAG TPA: c-type cytochrome [Longimicrobiales bacterium]|nr:c-type cytochrome [Longimicrobiales bacterium]